MPVFQAGYASPILATRTMKPFWLILSVNIDTNTITLLGWDNVSLEHALEIGKQRADPKDFVDAFPMDRSADEIGMSLAKWFVSCGMEMEEAGQAVRDMAKMIGEMMDRVGKEQVGRS